MKRDMNRKVIKNSRHRPWTYGVYRSKISTSYTLPVPQRMLSDRNAHTEETHVCPDREILNIVMTEINL